jgi:hypothetical protein
MFLHPSLCIREAGFLLPARKNLLIFAVLFFPRTALLKKRGGIGDAPLEKLPIAKNTICLIQWLAGAKV